MKRAGDKAPGFPVRLSSGAVVTLHELLRTHHAVISFYPRDFSPGCTRQMCAYRDHISAFETLGAIVIGISRDPEVRHRAFARSYRLPFPLVSDDEGAIARAYGVQPPIPFLPFRARCTFVVVRGGLIHAVIRHDLLFTKHVGDALRELKRMGNADASTGGVVRVDR